MSIIGLREKMVWTNTIKWAAITLPARYLPLMVKRRVLNTRTVSLPLLDKSNYQQFA